MNNITIVSIMLIILALLVSGLKLFYFIYSKKSQGNYNSNQKLNIAKPSYNKYKNIAHRISSPNAPKRKSGDFFDFVFADCNTCGNEIESNILCLYGEDCNE